MVERSRRRRGMYDITKTRMLLTTAVFAAVAALFAGGANAMVQDDGGGAQAVTTVQPGMSAGVDNALDPAIRHPIEDRVFWSGRTGDSALKVDRAVAAANEAYDTYRDKTAIAAREALFTDQQPSVQFRGAHRGLRPGTRYPGTVTLPTESSAGDGVDWSSFGVAAGLGALVAAGIAGVWVTTRRRGGVALP
jgi:hypothetical protein